MDEGKERIVQKEGDTKNGNNVKRKARWKGVVMNRNKLPYLNEELWRNKMERLAMHEVEV